MDLNIRHTVLSLVALLVAFVWVGCGRPGNPAAAGAGRSVAVSNHFAAITAVGEPLTLDQLSRIYAELPAADNAATLYERAFAALRGVDPNSPDFDVRRGEALRFLLQAADLPSCRYPIAFTNGPLIALPHLGNIRGCADLLRQEAINQSARGQTDDATTTLLAGFRLARSLDKEPFLLSRQVAFGILKQALDALQESLNRRSFTEANLLRLQAALQDAGSSVDLRQALLGERAILVTVFQSSDEGIAEALAGLSDKGSSVVPSLLHSYRSAGHLEGDFEFTLRFMSNLVALAAGPHPQALDASARLKVPDARTAMDNGLIISGLLLPAPDQILVRNAEASARIRIALTLVAVERHRLKHGVAQPVSLADVAAGLPDGIPTDPFDGQPLRYRKLPADGYVIYSVGNNRRDDEGQVAASDDGPSLDLGMRIAR